MDTFFEAAAQVSQLQAQSTGTAGIAPTPQSPTVAAASGRAPQGQLHGIESYVSSLADTYQRLSVMYQSMMAEAPLLPKQKQDIQQYYFAALDNLGRVHAMLKGARNQK